MQSGRVPGGVERVVLENYDAAPGHFGFLRVIVTAQQLRIEYRPASDGGHGKTPNDSVTIDLATRKRAPYKANDLGILAIAAAVRKKTRLSVNAPALENDARSRSASRAHHCRSVHWCARDQTGL